MPAPPPPTVDLNTEMGRITRPLRLSEEVSGDLQRRIARGDLKPGDRLSVELDGANNRLLGLNVASYLESPEDAVTLAVQFATLADGTSYTAQTTLDAKAKNVRVVTQNSGHRPVQK